MAEQDVCPQSLLTLQRERRAGCARPWLEAFHQQYWGRHNGARVAFEDDGSCRTVDCITNSFNLQHKSPLLVRDTYLELWEHLWASYLGVKDDENPLGGSGATIVYGHPGTGKSVALFYLMCAAAEAKIPFVFHLAGSATAFVCLDSGPYFIPIGILPSIVFVKRALVLIDSASSQLSPDAYDVPTAHVVFATCHKPALYKHLAKSTRALFFTMSLVDPDEFRAILRLRRAGMGVQHEVVPLIPAHTSAIALIAQDEVKPVRSNPAVAYEDAARTDVDLNAAVSCGASTSSLKFWDPVRVFELCGPNLRDALSPKLWTTGNPLELLGSKTRQLALQRTASSLAILADTLFFERPDHNGPVTHYPPANPVIPTSFLRGVVYAAVRGAWRGEHVQMLRQLDGLGAIHGLVFEAVALDYLATAPRFTAALSSSEETLNVRVLLDKPSRKYPEGYTLARTVTVWSTQWASLAPPGGGSDLEGLDSIADKLGFYETPSTLSSVNALMLAKGDDLCRYEILFQVTISEARSIKKPDIDTVVQALNRHTQKPSRRRIFLFVSNTPHSGRRLAAFEYEALSDWEIGYVALTNDDLSESLRDC
ncbi:hypothetical protein AURDEDRAFT_182493 [Auricularia subglabra TFB-10046 SS5]|nr:hypothetical protein AURDEDRAFT_182493 [Auricularia subglabra TFB-10046 SS5]